MSRAKFLAGMIAIAVMAAVSLVATCAMVLAMWDGRT